MWTPISWLPDLHINHQKRKPSSPEICQAFCLLCGPLSTFNMALHRRNFFPLTQSVSLGELRNQVSVIFPLSFHSFDKYLLSASYESGTVLDAGDTVAHKTKTLFSWSADCRGADRQWTTNQQINTREWKYHTENKGMIGWKLTAGNTLEQSREASYRRRLLS